MIKESVKKIAGAATFIFGLMEIHDVYQNLRSREITIKSSSATARLNWFQVADKVIVICAKSSLILSAGISRPGVFIISSLVGSIFSTAQLNRAFGTNTVFAMNPWHPRHVVSLVSVMLALPSLVQSIYKGINWEDAQTNVQNVRTWLTDAKIRRITLFNTITSRPVLHIGNEWSRFIFRPIS